MQEQGSEGASKGQENQPWERVGIRQLNPAHENLEELTESIRNMQIFLCELKQKKVALANNVVFNYCGKYEKMTISEKNVIGLLDRRIEKMMKNRKIKKNWSQEDLDLLAWATAYYADLHRIGEVQDMTASDWENVSKLIPGTTGATCMFKILGLKKVKLTEQNWTPEQSNLLFGVVTSLETIDWRKASQDLFNLNPNPDKIFRNAKQCKEHWSCYLNPVLRKGPWVIEEDILLLQNIIENEGKKRWTDMAKHFKGRTENALKNRFSLIMDKEKNAFRNASEREEVAVLSRIARKYMEKKMEMEQEAANPQPPASSAMDDEKREPVKVQIRKPANTEEKEVQKKEECGLKSRPKTKSIGKKEIEEEVNQKIINSPQPTKCPQFKGKKSKRAQLQALPSLEDKAKAIKIKQANVGKLKVEQKEKDQPQVESQHPNIQQCQQKGETAINYSMGYYPSMVFSNLSPYFLFFNPLFQ